MAIDFTHDDDSVTVVGFKSFMDLAKRFGFWALFFVYPVRWFYLVLQNGALAHHPGLIYIDAGVLYLDIPWLKDNARELIWLAVGILVLIILLYQAISDRREMWTFTAGRVDLTIRSRLGTRCRVWPGAKVVEIRLFISKSTYRNTYWPHVHLQGGKVLRLPLMGNREDADGVAQCLEDMFPGAKTNRFDIGMEWGE